MEELTWYLFECLPKLGLTLPHKWNNSSFWVISLFSFQLSTSGPFVPSCSARLLPPCLSMSSGFFVQHLLRILPFSLWVLWTLSWQQGLTYSLLLFFCFQLGLLKSLFSVSHLAILGARLGLCCLHFIIFLPSQSVQIHWDASSEKLFAALVLTVTLRSVCSDLQDSECLHLICFYIRTEIS